MAQALQLEGSRIVFSAKFSEGEENEGKSERPGEKKSGGGPRSEGEGPSVCWGDGSER